MDVWEEGDDYEGLEIACRGGTRIKPVFDWINNEIDEQIDWMICFTDCQINDYPKPSEAPDFPVLWASTGKDNTPFGTYLPMKSALEMPA
jgi:predicted metal-dependent peptidase